MKKTLFQILGFTLLCVHLSAQINVNYKISTQSGRKQISPFIYGTCFDLRGDENHPFYRLGGNSMTAYNWENNYTNIGGDWFHSNAQAVNDSVVDKPGYVLTNFHEKAKKNNAKEVLLMPMAGYVAKDKNGEVKENEIAPSSRWCKVMPKKSKPFLLAPDKQDDTVYIDECVNYLVNKYGKAKDGGVFAYGLDNEIELWDYNHKMMHPNKATCKEILNNSVLWSSAIKSVDNSAEVFSAQFWEMPGIYNLEDAPDWTSVKGSYNWYLDYYIDNLKKASDSVGYRLVDVIDIHRYGGKEEPMRLPDENISDAAKKDLLQSPRVLWDPTYNEGSWIYNVPNYKPYLPYIPGIMNTIKQYDPEMKLAITEYDYGGGWDITGAITLSDVLGIYGKFGVYAATYWKLTDVKYTSYLSAAFRLYNNYDEKNSKYGSIYADATSSDMLNSPVYSSLSETSDSVLHIITMNKSLTDTIRGSYSIDGNITYKNAQVFMLQGGSTRIVAGQKFLIGNNKFNYILPPLSVAHIVVSANTNLEYVSSTIKSNDNKIYLKFSYPVVLPANITGLEVVKNEVDTLVLSSISHDASDSTVLVLQANSALTANDVISLHYNNGNIKTYDGFKLAPFSNKLVNNMLPGAAPQVLKAFNTLPGNKIILEFNKILKSNSRDAYNDFQIKVAGNNYTTVDSITFINNDSTDLTLYLAKSTLRGQSISLSYSGSKVESTDNGVLKAINNLEVENFAGNTSPLIKSIKLVDFGANIQLVFDKKMIKAYEFRKSFELMIDNQLVEITDLVTKDTIINIAPIVPVRYSQAIMLSFKEGDLMSVDSGYVKGFSNYVVENTLQVPVEYNLPCIIQAEGYSASYGTQNETTSDTGGGENVGYMDTNDWLEYYVNVSNDTTFTVNYRVAALFDGSLILQDEGVTITDLATLTIPSSGAWQNWTTLSNVVKLTKGQHILRIMVSKGGFNLNWIEFKEGDFRPLPKIVSANVISAGNRIELLFDKELKTFVNKQSDFSLTVDGVKWTIANATLKGTSGDSKKTIAVVLSTPIRKDNNQVLLSYTGKAIFSIENIEVQEFKNLVIKNSSDVTSISQNNLSEFVELYPVPATDIITIKSPYYIQKVEIIDFSGQVLYQFEVNSNEPTFNLSPNVMAGIYFLKLYSYNGIIIKKFIKK